MKSYRIIVGTTENKAGRLIGNYSLSVATLELQGLLVKACGGFTQTSGHGQWRNDETGRTIHDDVLQYEIFTTNDVLPCEMAKTACRIFDQACVVLISPDNSVAFVTR